VDARSGCGHGDVYCYYFHGAAFALRIRKSLAGDRPRVTAVFHAHDRMWVMK